MTLWLDDYVIGRELMSPGRMVTEADVMAFAGLTGDYHPLHTDATFAAGTEFGERVAHGLLGLGLAFGLLARGGYFEPAVVALLGVNDWRFHAPVRLGDTVRSHGIVRDARPSARRAECGIVTLAIELTRADEVIAQHGEVVLLVRRSAESAPAEQGAG